MKFRPLPALKNNLSVHEGEQSIVTTDSDLIARVELRPPLANDDCPRRNPLARHIS